MADLKFNEKTILESALGMKSGFVFDFTNYEFQEFVKDSVGIDIYDSKYEHRSGSKANRLRSFFAIESNSIVASVIKDLMEFWITNCSTRNVDWNEEEWKSCVRVAERLESLGTNMKINPSRFEKPFDEDFSKLRASIDNHLSKSEFELALDRMHTYMMYYSRKLCETHNLIFDKSEPLNAVFGKYVKAIQQDSRVDSKMSISILKKSISLLSDFNNVRNEQSFAHANRTLNGFEAKLIASNIQSLLEFLEEFEMMHFASLADDIAYDSLRDNDDLPF